MVTWWRLEVEPKMVHPKGLPCRLNVSEAGSLFQQGGGSLAKQLTLSVDLEIRRSGLRLLAFSSGRAQMLFRRLQVELRLPILYLKSQLNSMRPLRLA